MLGADDADAGARRHAEELCAPHRLPRVRRELHSSRDLGLILDDAFALYREHWRTLLSLAAIVVVPVELGVLGAGLGWLWEGYDGGRSWSDTVVADFTHCSSSVRWSRRWSSG